MSDAHPFLLAGERTESGDLLPVYNPYTGEVIAEVHRAQPAHLEHATQAAVAAQAELRALTASELHAILRKTSNAIEAQASKLAESICAEAGKPMKYALGEATRAVQTFGFAADLAQHLRGETLDLSVRPGFAGKRGIVERVPAGPVLGITPFNFPLNLVAHKLAPAILARCPIVLKPASATPLTALLLGEILLEAGLPLKALSVVPCAASNMAPLIKDDRFKVLSFTGGDGLGWQLKSQAGKKRVLLELGGDAAAVVLNDADLDHAVARCVEGAFAYAGQVCISLQRIVLHEEIYSAFKAKFLAAVAELPVGDPADHTTVCGPMIDAENVQRIRAWIAEAENAGACVSLGGADASHNLVRPTVLENVPPEVRLRQDEAFGPVVLLQKVARAEAAWAAVNQSRFGLQAGVFTHDIRHIRAAYEQLEVGGVVVNDVPLLRVDHMPYGGVKDSGFGREGIRYAYEEMTEPRLLVW